MAEPPYDSIPEELKKAAAEPPKKPAPKTGGEPNKTGTERPQRGLFKKKRAGVVLSKEQVQEIRKGRKKLRRELKARGIKSREEFELIAGSMGLYFDKRSGFLMWLLRGRGLWALLGALLLLLGAFFLMSLVSQMRGYFTINLSDGMFKEGFTLSPTVGFENPSVSLFCEPAADVPCVSFIQISEDVDQTDGQHNGDYFAYTFYCRNEGESTVDYTWDLELIDEAQSLSTAAWVMVFEDGKMCFYAKPSSDTGAEEALPAFDDDTRGYLRPPLMTQARYPDKQYQVIREKNGITFYRLVPFRFAEDNLVASGLQQSVEPMEVHKYTVVIWLEGDDPDANVDRMGGHLGLAMQFRLVEESRDGLGGGKKSWWKTAWDSLKWWR